MGPVTFCNLGFFAMKSGAVNPVAIVKEDRIWCRQVVMGIGEPISEADHDATVICACFNELSGRHDLKRLSRKAIRLIAPLPEPALVPRTSRRQRCSVEPTP
jgi:hypothetical protein